MKELTEEKPDPNNGVKFESMNISVGEIFPKKKISSRFSYKNIIKIILFILTALIIIAMTIIIFKINNYNCEIGEEDKCLVCSKWTNKCLKCNPG